MDAEKFTKKSLEVIESCEKLAYEYNNQELTQAHLMYALVTVEDSLIAKLLTNMGINMDAFTGECEKLVANRPKVSGGQLFTSPEFSKALIQAEKEAKQMGDDYISVEHIFLGLLEKADKDAVWLQMTWLFWNERKYWTNDRVKPYITSFPADRQLLLDYYCERQEVWQRTNKYFGVPYIWCYLGNFGGNTMLVGDVKNVNKLLENTFKNGGKNFTGIGSTLEGFDCNPFMYSYVFEKAWDFKTHRDIPAWTRALADQRTGKADQNARQAWRLLIDSIYVAPSVPGQCPLINIRPTFGKYRTYYANPRIKYTNRTLLQATELMLKADSKERAYEFDVANLTRQLLSNHFLTVFRKYEQAYNRRDRAQMSSLQKDMMGIINDVDRIVATQEFFLVGKWIKDARSWGGDSLREARYYEQNARNLITTWSDKDQLLNDYASRTWAGLTKTFYGERWRMFFNHVNKALDEGRSFDEDHFAVYRDAVTTFERYWWQQCLGNFSDKPIGDSKQIAKELVAKYHDSIMAE